MSLDIAEQRLSSAKDRIRRYIDQNIMIWATEEVLLPGQSDIAASVSQRASDGLSLEKSGFMKVELVWDFRGDDNQPIHFYLEYGTKPHRIEAKGKMGGGADWLHWKGPSGGFVIGKDHFAKMVRHPGTEPKMLIHGIRDERLPALEKRIASEVQNHLEIDKT
mgnify:FL=1